MCRSNAAHHDGVTVILRSHRSRIFINQNLPFARDRLGNRRTSCSIMSNVTSKTRSVPMRNTSSVIRLLHYGWSPPNSFFSFPLTRLTRGNASVDVAACQPCWKLYRILRLLRNSTEPGTKVVPRAWSLCRLFRLPRKTIDCHLFLSISLRCFPSAIDVCTLQRNWI